MKLKGFKRFVAFNRTWCVIETFCVSVLRAGWSCWCFLFLSPSGAQRPVVRALPDGARDSERLERHGEDLAVCLLQGAAADLLWGGELLFRCCVSCLRFWSGSNLVLCGFLCSILCCWPRLLSIPARTERRLQRFSLKPSMFLLSSSPCRLCWACKNLELV